MPSLPIRRAQSSARARRAADDRPSRQELESIQAALEEIKSRLDAVPGRVAQATKAIEAQHKRLEALAEGLQKAKATAEATRAGVAALTEAAGRGPLARAAERLRTLGARPKPAPPTPKAGEPAAAVATAPKVNWVLAGGRAAGETRAVMVVLFGLGTAEIEQIVGKLGATDPAAVGQPVRVFLTDCSNFDVFRQSGLPFEYLPPVPAEASRRGHRDWGVYPLRRFALLCEKWQPVEVIGFGLSAAAQLAAWQASPHLPDSVKQLLATANDAPAGQPQQQGKRAGNGSRDRGQ